MANTRLRKRQLGDDAMALTPTPIAYGASPYTVLDADALLFVDVALGAVTILLPAVASSNAGRRITIRDQLGHSANNAITLTPNGANTIEGDTTLVLAATRIAVTLESDGVSEWAVIARN